MRIKGEFLIETIGDVTVALPRGEDGSPDMMISLNETGRFLWDLLAVENTEAELVEALMAEYEVDRESAERDVRSFVTRCREQDFIS